MERGDKTLSFGFETGAAKVGVAIGVGGSAAAGCDRKRVAAPDCASSIKGSAQLSSARDECKGDLQGNTNKTQGEEVIRNAGGDRTAEPVDTTIGSVARRQSKGGGDRRSATASRFDQSWIAGLALAAAVAAAVPSICCAAASCMAW